MIGRKLVNAAPFAKKNPSLDPFWHIYSFTSTRRRTMTQCRGNKVQNHLVFRHLEGTALGFTTLLVKIYTYKGYARKNEPLHEISKNMVCTTSKASDQPAHTRSLIRAFAIRLSIL